MKEQQWLEDGWFYHNHAWHLLHEYLKLIREVDDAKSLLDVGAGTGLAAAVIRGVFPELKVCVSDIEEECTEYWNERKLSGYVGQITNVSFETWKSGGFSIALCSHVLEHLFESKEFIQNLFNITNKRLIIAVPDGDVHFYDHKVIYNRAKLESTIREALHGKKYTYCGFPVYHAHMNNLVAVVDK